MTAAALGLTLGAALLHAIWNALLKGAATDRAVVLGAISTVHAVAGLALILTSPLPDPASWLAIAVSTIVHYAYYALLFYSYRHGDLSLVYPIARGLAPLLVTLGAVVLIGEVLPPGGWLGVLAISCGIGLLALGAWTGAANRAGLGLAICVGLAIATYSVADGIGIRASGTITGYIGWLFLLECPVPMAVALWRIRAGQIIPLRSVAIGLAGGLFAASAYALVLVANTLAPLGGVSAIRESSVIVAALIGVVLFRERPVPIRLAAAVIVAGGVALLALTG